MKNSNDFVVIQDETITNVIDINKGYIKYQFTGVSKYIFDNLKKDKDEMINELINKYNQIDRNIIINDYNEFINELSEIGIYKHNFKPKNIFRISENYSNKIKYCVIEITNKCCFFCDHCYISDNNNIMSLEIFKKIIDELLQIGCDEILITGGEPMLNPEFINMYLYAKSRGFLVSINSNLFMLNDKILKVLSEFKPRILEVSLYGYDNNTYKNFTHVNNSYEIVFKNIKLLLNNNINVGIKTVLTKKTKNYIYKIKEIANQLKLPFRFDYIIFPKFGKTIENNERLNPKEIAEVLYQDKELIKYYKELIKNQNKEKEFNNNIFQCSVGIDRIFIDSNLNIKTCLLVNEKYKYGDYKLITAMDEFNSAKAKMTFKDDNKCKNCPKKVICRYCPGRFFLETGNYQKAPQFYCDLADEIIKKFGE